LTQEEEEQWKPSNINSDNDELSNTNNKSKEHDSDEFNIYTTSKGKDEDKDDGEEYLHIGEKVDMKGAEKWYRLGERTLGMKKKRREPLEKEHCKKKKSSLKKAHREALRASNQEIWTLLHAQPADIMQNMLMSEGTADANIGEYHNEMD
jgi:hypothetical protein